MTDYDALLGIAADGITVRPKASETDEDLMDAELNQATITLWELYERGILSGETYRANLANLVGQYIES